MEIDYLRTWVGRGLCLESFADLRGRTTPTMSTVRDSFQRPLRDLRISVTDRCNFRCPYCMPREVFGPGYAFLKDPQLMSLAELRRIVAAFRALGVEKIRLTGGEPLLRADVPDLIRMLKTELGVPDVALTTNGWIAGRR